RQVAVLELLTVGPDLGVDERADRVAHHQQLFRPLEHPALPLIRPIARLEGTTRLPRPSDRKGGLRTDREGLTMRTRTLGIGLLIGVVPLALASCGNGESKSSSAGSAASGRPAAGAGGAKQPSAPSPPGGVDLAVA